MLKYQYTIVSITKTLNYIKIKTDKCANEVAKHTNEIVSTIERSRTHRHTIAELVGLPLDNKIPSNQQFAKILPILAEHQLNTSFIDTNYIIHSFSNLNLQYLS